MELCCIFVLVVSVTGFETYQQNIPNGHMVQHPCKPNHIWHGVGHKSSAGGHSLNFFGKDLAMSGMIWTKYLCVKDSDGDGRSNGEELGDPQCIWTPGEHPEKTFNITHPGICEPLNDPKCQHQMDWLGPECQSQPFQCDSINEKDVNNITVQFPKTLVPRVETTYICLGFHLPTDDDYHLIATQPVIYNRIIMHHAVLFGCEDDADLDYVPKACNMVPSTKCKDILSIWTVGLSGDCIHPSTGFRIGKKGFKKAALQFHWNNPAQKPNYYDQSAFILYYTSNRRLNDAGILTIGASYLNIKPHVKQTEYTSYCPEECTRLSFKGKVYIVSAMNHMHYLGVSQKIELYRNGSKMKDITNNMKYNYDNPYVDKFTEAIEVLPGDSLSTTCIYNSFHKKEVTYFGDSTSDEMCFGFLTYYPKERITLSSCTSWKSIPSCVIHNHLTYRECNLSNFLRLKSFEFVLLFQKFMKVCDATCSSNCKSVVDAIRDFPCMKGDFRDYIQEITKHLDKSQQFFNILHLCSKNSLNSNLSDSAFLTKCVSPVLFYSLVLMYIIAFLF